MMLDRHVDDDIAAALSGALDARDRARVDAHLASCARCTRVRSDQASVLAALAGATDELAPRPIVKLRMLAEARVSLGGDVPASVTPPGRPRRLLPFRMDTASSNRFLRWASLWMAAAFIIGLVGGVTGWALVLGDRLDKKSNDLDASRDTLATLVQSDHITTLDGSVDATPVHAAIGVAASGTGVVVVSDAPVASSGMGYHLWMFENGTAELAAVLTPDTHGVMIARLDEDLAAYDRIQLDLEPVGARAPGGTVVLAGALP